MSGGRQDMPNNHRFCKNKTEHSHPYSNLTLHRILISLNKPKWPVPKVPSVSSRSIQPPRELSVSSVGLPIPSRTDTLSSTKQTAKVCYDFTFARNMVDKNRNRRSWSEGQGINAGCAGTSLLYTSIEPPLMLH